MWEIDGCEGECESDTSSSAASSEVPPTESEQFEAAEAGSQAAALKASYSRLLKQPVRPRQAPTTIHVGNQTTGDGVCPLGRESLQVTQHCNIWSQRSYGIPSIKTIWRRICGGHLTTTFSPRKCLPREVCASLDKKGPMH